MTPPTKADRDALRALLANRPDCRGNPCIFGNRGGQRTQGGCHCIPRGGMKPGVSSFIQRATDALPGLLDALDAAEEERDRLHESLMDVQLDLARGVHARRWDYAESALDMLDTALALRVPTGGGDGAP